MTRFMREYSKSQLVKVTEHAVKKQLVAEEAYRQLRRRVWAARVLCALVGFVLGWLVR